MAMNLPLILIALGGAYFLSRQYMNTAANLRALVTGVRFNAAAALRGQAAITVLVEVTNPTQLPINLQSVSATLATSSGNNIATADIFEPISLPATSKRTVMIPLRLRAGFLFDVASNLKALGTLNLTILVGTNLGQTKIQTAVDPKSFLPV